MVESDVMYTPQFLGRRMSFYAPGIVASLAALRERHGPEVESIEIAIMDVNRDFRLLQLKGQNTTKVHCRGYLKVLKFYNYVSLTSAAVLTEIVIRTLVGGHWELQKKLNVFGSVLLVYIVLNIIIKICRQSMRRVDGWGNTIKFHIFCGILKFIVSSGCAAVSAWTSFAVHYSKSALEAYYCGLFALTLLLVGLKLEEAFVLIDVLIAWVLGVIVGNTDAAGELLAYVGIQNLSQHNIEIIVSNCFVCLAYLVRPVVRVVDLLGSFGETQNIDLFSFIQQYVGIHVDFPTGSDDCAQFVRLAHKRATSAETLFNQAQVRADLLCMDSSVPIYAMNCARRVLDALERCAEAAKTASITTQEAAASYDSLGAANASKIANSCFEAASAANQAFIEAELAIIMFGTQMRNHVDAVNNPRGPPPQPPHGPPRGPPFVPPRGPPFVPPRGPPDMPPTQYTARPSSSYPYPYPSPGRPSSSYPPYPFESQLEHSVTIQVPSGTVRQYFHPDQIEVSHAVCDFFRKSSHIERPASINFNRLMSQVVPLVTALSRFDGALSRFKIVDLWDKFTRLRSLFERISIKRSKLPSPPVSKAVVESYNSEPDDEALFDFFRKSSHIERPTNINCNGFISQVAPLVTALSRFDGALKQIENEFKDASFILSSYAAAILAETGYHEQREFSEPGEDWSVLDKVDDLISEGEDDDELSEELVPDCLMHRSDFLPNDMNAIKTKTTTPFVGRCQTSFKCSINHQPPTVVCGGNLDSDTRRSISLCEGVEEREFSEAGEDWSLLDEVDDLISEVEDDEGDDSSGESGFVLERRTEEDMLCRNENGVNDDYIRRLIKNETPMTELDLDTDNRFLFFSEPGTVSTCAARGKAANKRRHQILNSFLKQMFVDDGTQNVQAAQKYSTCLDARRISKLPEHRYTCRSFVEMDLLSTFVL